MQFEATIFGGLPVVVEATRQPAERDVGILYDHFEIEAIYTTRTRKRDRRVVMRPIPDSWWTRLDKSGGLEELAEIAAENW